VYKEMIKRKREEMDKSRDKEEEIFKKKEYNEEIAR